MKNIPKKWSIKKQSMSKENPRNISREPKELLHKTILKTLQEGLAPF